MEAIDFLPAYSSSSSLPAQRVIRNHEFSLYPQESIWFSRSRTLHGKLSAKYSGKSAGPVFERPHNCDTATGAAAHARRGASEGPRHQTNPSDPVFPERMIHINTSMSSLHTKCLFFLWKQRHFPKWDDSRSKRGAALGRVASD